MLHQVRLNFVNTGGACHPSDLLKKETQCPQTFVDGKIGQKSTIGPANIPQAPGFHQSRRNSP